MRSTFRSLLFLLAPALLLALLPGRTAGQGTAVPRTCGQSLPFSPSAGTAALVGPGSVSSPASPAQANRNLPNAIYICGYTLDIGSASTAQFEYGTQTTTACDTGTVTISPIWPASTVIADNSPFYRGMGAPASTTLCLVTTGTVLLQLFYSNIAP